MNEPLRDDAVSHDSADSADTADTADTAESQSATEFSDEPTVKLPPPSATESLINALVDAGPEVAEHVVKAAQELILAVQTVIDAADQSIRERQDLRPDLREDSEGSKDSEDSATETSADKPNDTVRHLDIAE